MKQHITVEQVFELETFDELGFETWDKICKLNTIADIYFNTDCKNFGECCHETARQMTIGKMIEILNITYIDYHSCVGEWVIGYPNLNKKVGNSSNELCDALWECVKNKLKEI